MKQIIFLSALMFLGLTVHGQISIPPYPMEITCEAGFTSELDPPAAFTTCENVEVTVDVEEALASGGGCAGKMIITYTYHDTCDNVATAQLFVTLKDTQEPEFYERPEDIRLKRGDLVPFAPYMEAYDLSGMSCPATLAEKQVDDVIIRTWTASDACGNKAEHTQKIYLPY